MRKNGSVFVCAILAVCSGGAAMAQNVLAVDCPGVFPNQLGAVIQLCDTTGVLSVTQMNTATFRAQTAVQLAAFDGIVVSNQIQSLSDNCDGAAPNGLGTTWHGVVGINGGGRVVLTNHDAPRFHSTVPPNSTPMSGPCPGCEPFGTCVFIDNVVKWIAGRPGTTGLAIFNDAQLFSGGVGWNNPELQLPAAWNITGTDASGGQGIVDGGYTAFTAPFNTTHPIYSNGLTMARLAPLSINSFAANIGDASYHDVFTSFNNTIFQQSEETANSGISDPGGFGCCSSVPIVAPNGSPVTILRDNVPVPASSTRNILALGVSLLAAIAFVLALRLRRRAPI